MTALTASRDTKRMGDDAVPALKSYPVADNVHIYKGAIVGLDAAGNAGPASATYFNVVGCAMSDADNTLAGHVAAGINVAVRQGVFKYINGTGGGAFTKADVGSPCFVYDDQTVQRASGPKAGIVAQVDADGVFVQMGPEGKKDTYITATVPVSSGNACDVACSIKNAAGGALAAAVPVTITAVPVTEGAGNGALAAATAAVGTIVKALNPATGPHTLCMDTSATGTFSFKVSDAVAEAVMVRIEAEGCLPVVRKISILA